MKTKTATAMALALVVGAVGLSVTPIALAAGECDSDYEIPDLKPSTGRDLDDGESEVGHHAVSFLEADQELSVELMTSNDELSWKVFRLNGSSCGEYDAANCDKVIDQQEIQTCTLDAPQSGTWDYYVVFKNIEDSGDQLTYRAWV